MLEVEKSLLARIKKLKLSYYGHIMRKATCLQKDIIQGCVQGAEVGGDQGDDGRKTSVTGRDCGSTMQQDLRKTGTVGKGSYVSPTLQLEDGNRRRRRRRVSTMSLIGMWQSQEPSDADLSRDLNFLVPAITATAIQLGYLKVNSYKLAANTE